MEASRRNSFSKVDPKKEVHRDTSLQFCPGLKTYLESCTGMTAHHQECDCCMLLCHCMLLAS